MPRWDTVGLSDVERFWFYVEKSDGCWLWKGKRNRYGYGRFWLGGKDIPAAAYSLQIATGGVVTKFALHRCDVPACVRPDHLFEGTQLDNIRDKIAKGRARIAINEGMPTFKLTGVQVTELRTRFGTETQAALARQFGVHQSTISRIARGLRRRRGDVGTHMILEAHCAPVPQSCE